MTVSASYAPLVYAGNGATVAFPVTWPFVAAADLLVTEVVDATGVETVKALTTHYTVVRTTTGGTVTALVAPATGKTWRIERRTAITQPGLLRLAGSYNPETVEAMIDRPVLQIQELDERVPPFAPAKALAPLVYGADGETVEPGSTTLTGDMLLRGELASTGASKGTKLVATLAAGAGAVSRTVEAKLREAVSVKDFGALGDGVTDDSVAFQAAFDAVVSGGRIHIPAGTYVVNSTITMAGKSLTLSGDGPNATIIFKTAGTNCVAWSTTVLSGARTSYLVVEDLTFTAGGTGSRGRAVSATWPASLAARATCTLRNIAFNSDTYDASICWWGDCLHVKNATQALISDIKSLQVGSANTTHIRLDYGNDAGAFALMLENLFLQGGAYGIHQTGWVENVRATGGEIVGQLRGIYFDASASLIPSSPAARNPVLMISGFHVNSLEWGVYVQGWHAVDISGMDMYHGVGGTGDISGGCIYVQDGLSVLVRGSKFESGRGVNVLVDNLIKLKNVTIFSVTSNVLGQSVTTQINAETVSKGTIATNLIAGSGAANPVAIYVSGTVAANTDVVVSDNNVSGTNGIGIQLENVQQAAVRNNTLRNTTTPVSVIGTVGPRIVLTGNLPTQPPKDISGSTTPSISGAPNGECSVANAGATTITDFLNGDAGQTIHVRSDNANTTIAHGANIRLSGAVNFVMGTDSAVVLVLAGNGTTWREVSRRT